jgi:polar amino acid transport system substrate-binding protein
VNIRRSLTLFSVALVLAACSSTPAATETPTGTPAPTVAPTVAPTIAPTVVPTMTAVATATTGPTASPTATVPASPTVPPMPEACAMNNLVLKNPGQLTLSTDNPAYPPWYGGDPKTQYPGQASGGVKWKISNPYSDMGFEDAVDYAIAAKLGFTPEHIVWLQNTVFEQAFAPGEKPFDWHTAQISITPQRAQAVDFSDPYFDSVQSIVALQSDPITSATSIADLKSYKLGAAANTTSYDLIQNAIQPTTAASVFPDNDTAVIALQNGQIDGLIVDLGTAFYMRDAQLTGGTIVGQFAPTVQTDHVGAVLDKDSPLTPCVDWAIEAMKADGTLQQIYDQWITTGQDIPLFQ